MVYELSAEASLNWVEVRSKNGRLLLLFRVNRAALELLRADALPPVYDFILLLGQFLTFMLFRPRVLVQRLRNAALNGSLG